MGRIQSLEICYGNGGPHKDSTAHMCVCACVTIIDTF